MPRRLPELEESSRKTAAKSAASRSSVFTGVEWDNDTVSKCFLIIFSILTDIAPDTQYVEHNRKGHCGNKNENRKGANTGGDAVS
jgi:hypothetical protein